MTGFLSEVAGERAADVFGWLLAARLWSSFRDVARPPRPLHLLGERVELVGEGLVTWFHREGLRVCPVDSWNADSTAVVAVGNARDTGRQLERVAETAALLIVGPARVRPGFAFELRHHLPAERLADLELCRAADWPA